MTSIDKSFTALGSGVGLSVKHGDVFSYAVSGTFSGTVKLERSNDGGQSYEPLLSFTAAGSGEIRSNASDRGQYLYRFRCSAFVSGTIVTNLQDVPANAKKRMITSGGKVGATAGFAVGGGAVNTGLLATIPAGQTASTLVVPIHGLKVGDVITGFHAVGQVESGGNAATVDLELRKMTAAAADVVDATVAAITQVSVTADAILSASNAGKTGLSQLVSADESYYFLVTSTTAAATDVALQAIAVSVVEA